MRMMFLVFYLTGYSLLGSGENQEEKVVGTSTRGECSS